MRDMGPEETAPPTGAVTRPAPLMEATQLSLAIGRQVLVDRVDLSIRPGATTVLMGANGAGKSVLLRLLHGLHPPTAGAIRWEGHQMGRAARRQQAMVFQHPVMLRRSVRANLDFALAAQGVPRQHRAQRAEAALELADLAPLAARPARLLSGGQQQRLAVARALACRPRLLLADEPTASLDPAATLAVEDMLRAARADGVTIVLVTHNTGQARRLGDDLVFLHQGRVAEAGPAQAVLTDPASEPLRAWLDGRLYLDP